ncbi:MAG: hypothetical protein ABEJ93_04550 [Candidatus Nanohalobium sp.]
MSFSVLAMASVFFIRVPVATVLLLVLPAVYWSPYLQEFLDLDRAWLKWTLFLGQVAVVLSVLAVGILTALTLSMFLMVMWGSLAVSGLFQLLVLVFIFYRLDYSSCLKYFEYLKEKATSRKYVKIFSTGILTVLVMFFAVTQGLSFYVDSMVDPVNEDAVYPEKAFEPIYEKAEGPDPDEVVKAKNHFLKGGLNDVSESTLEKRLTVSGMGLLDAALTAGPVSKAFQEVNRSSLPQYRGRVIVIQCEESQMRDFSLIKCRDLKYPAGFSAIYKGWMKRGMAVGTLENLVENRTARKKFNRYIKRATYYDSYLIEDFRFSPVEAVYYSSDSGLYLIGSGSRPVFVDGGKINVTEYGSIFHADISLSPGYHTVRRADSSVKLPVYGFRPEYEVYDNGTFEVEGYGNRSVFFQKIVLNGDGWKKEVMLGRESVRTQVPGNVTEVKYVKGNFSLTYEKPGSTSSRPMGGEAFGMTKQEYQRFRWIMSKAGFLIGYSERPMGSEPRS